MRILILALALLCATTAAAAQRTWVVDPANSELVFVYLIDGKERIGEFHSFSGQARFDPDSLLSAEMTLEIDAASIDAGEPFATQFVRSVDWLWIDQYPVARYELQSLVRVAPDLYHVRGALTLRGATRTVDGEMEITLDEEAASAIGEARFSRKEFGVGVGFSTLFVEVGAEIAVRFQLTARPAP